MHLRPILWASIVLVAACVARETVDTPGDAILRAVDAWKSIQEKNNNEVFRTEYFERFRPFTATLANGTWTVRWTVPSGYTGQVLETTVRQADGAVSVNGKLVGG